MKEQLLPVRFGPAVILLSVALGAVHPLTAQQRIEFGVAGGFHMFDNQLELASGVGIAGRLGFRVIGPLELEGEASYARPHTDTPLRQRVGATTFGGWLLLNHGIGERASVFIKGGYASVNFGSCPTVSVVGSGPCGSAGVIQGGLGARFALTPMIQMRYDATINRSLTDLKFSNVTLQAGLALMFGGTRPQPRSKPRPLAAAPPPAPKPAPVDTAPAPKPAPAQQPAAVDTTAAAKPFNNQPAPAPPPVAQPKPDTTAVAGPAAPTAKTSWVLPGTVWPYRAAVLQVEAFPVLDSIAKVAKANPNSKVEIRGYAFDRLIPTDDRKLSQFRADAVKSYLTFKGVEVSRITALGRGSEPLIDKGETEEARTANRRVEIRIIQP